jgi:hypothetical protein
MLSPAVPMKKMGIYMGICNFFIVIPQILAASMLGILLRVDDREERSQPPSIEARDAFRLERAPGALELLDQFRTLAHRHADRQRIDDRELRQPRRHRRVDIRVFVH